MNASLLEKLGNPETWKAFYRYKASLVCPNWLLEELSAFIAAKKYLPVTADIEHGVSFPLPRKAVISKLSTQKKRTVYIYPGAYNTVLKCLTWLMLRKYDSLFADNLYSFRPGRSAKNAVRRLLRVRDLGSLYAYKADIHDYFNSIPVEAFLEKLKKALDDDPQLYDFLSGLLSEPRVLEDGEPVEEKKGIMAGTPQSSFFANLYLAELDRYFEENNLLYCRYSDDIIVFAPTEEEVHQHAQTIRSFLENAGLSVNPAKEAYSTPAEGFTFLGFSIHERRVDIAPATVKKLKQKMRRKRDALTRWQKRSASDPDRAAAAFIRVFNRKLLESPQDHELSWASWFFSVINTTDSLHEIDCYAQDCLRYLLSGSHNKARFRVKYEDLKALGYRSLVHEYYAAEAREQREAGADVRARHRAESDAWTQSEADANVKELG